MKLLPSLLAGLHLVSRVKSISSSSDWESLTSLLGEKLVTNIRPPAAPCRQGSYNAAECATVVAQWQSSSWRSTQIGAMQTTTWEQLNGQWCDITINNQTRMPTNSTGPISSACPQGNVPRFGINATTASDVLKAVQFANKLSIPLVIKSTGHDYLGRSSDPNRLLLWTYHMKKITYGISHICGTNYSDTLTVAAGVQWGEAYRALAPHQRITPGGADPDVGASGGQVMGGGHSLFSNTYGLTADSVLQFEVVTLDGVMRTVNQCSNPDLFWALRGGGGGTYAVVTSTTFKSYADAPTAFAAFNYNFTDGFALGLTHLANYSASLAELGWSGYFYVPKGSFSGVFFLPLINNLTFQTAVDSFQPLFKALNATQGLHPVSTSVSQFPSAQFYLGGKSHGPRPMGGNGVLGSRLIPKALLQEPSSRTNITNIIASIRNDSAPSTMFVGHLVAGGVPTKPTNSSILPAWRKALWHLFFTSVPPVDASEKELEANFKLVTDKLELLRQATPGSGAYMNEAHSRAPQWKEDFFGENYAKLLEIKKKWDPNGLLRCNRCVGSDL